jgi:phage terminase small subunit
MSRARKPHNLKVVAGTARPDRAAPVVDLPSIDEIPPAPEWMPNGHAVREWERLTRVLVANRLLTEGGLSALGQMCALHGKIVQLYAAGESPNAALIAQYRALANDFGLTPVAQGKVRPHGDEPAKNEFTQNRKQAKPRA